MSTQFLIRLSLALACAPAALAADAGRLWTGKVQALLDVQCVKCHGPIEQKGGLELDTPQAVLKGGDDGVVVVPGKPEESPLYLKLAEGVDAHMPPKKQLSQSEREAIREWIAAMTVATPEEGKTRVERQFGSVTDAVDVLIAEVWTQHGVTPAPPLADNVFCRRVTLDVAGRIPTAKETAEFLAAPEATRRSELVDRLLSSNEYAVRMRELWDVFLMGRAKRAGQEDKRRQNGWWTFLESSFRANRPWNETVHAILSARPQTPEEKGATWFLYERKNEHQAIAEAVAIGVCTTLCNVRKVAARAREPSAVASTRKSSRLVMSQNVPCRLLEKKNRDWGPMVKGEANGRKLAGLNGLRVTVSARTTALEFIASGFDAGKLLSGRKAQSFRDTIFQCIDVSVFKFDDAIAIHTDEMAVSGMINVVGVVQHLIFAEIQLFKKAALHKERQCSINRCTGYRRLNFTSPL